MDYVVSIVNGAKPAELAMNVYSHVSSSSWPEEGSVHVAGVAVALDPPHSSNQNVLNLLRADRRDSFQLPRAVPWLFL